MGWTSGRLAGGRVGEITCKKRRKFKGESLKEKGERRKDESQIQGWDDDELFFEIHS